SILAQVAFKAAVETAPAYVDDGVGVDGSCFEQAFSYYQESLTAAVKAAMDSVSGSVASYTPTPAPAAVNVDPAAVLNRELGAAPVIEVVNKDGQQGPFPERFLAAAAKD